MKFLIDADCPRSIGTVLKDVGYDVMDIRDINPAAPDQFIYELIKKEGRILITRDTDFANILRYPVTSRCGIILLRVYLLSVDEIIEVVNDLLKQISTRDLRGCLIIARKGRYRIHKL